MVGGHCGTMVFILESGEQLFKIGNGCHFSYFLRNTTEFLIQGKVISMTPPPLQTPFEHFPPFFFSLFWRTLESSPFLHHPLLQRTQTL